MKTYSRKIIIEGNSVAVDVNVPTPKELQAVTTRGDIKIVISNFSYGSTKSYSVAKFEKETDEHLIRMGFTYKTVAKDCDIYSFEGAFARESVIAEAACLLVGW